MPKRHPPLDFNKTLEVAHEEVVRAYQASEVMKASFRRPDVRATAAQNRDMLKAIGTRFTELGARMEAADKALGAWGDGDDNVSLDALLDDVRELGAFAKLVRQDVERVLYPLKLETDKPGGAA